MLIQELKLYENREDVTLTAFLINNKGELREQGPRPAVLICPGGGYFSCSDTEAEPVALAFNAMGYHAFILRYSTYLQGGQENIFGEDFAPKSETAHPAPIREIGLSLRVIRDHGSEWLVDVDRVALCGFSAGAHNAAMYGVYWDKPLVTEYLGEAIRPAALILGYTLSDYVFLHQWIQNGNPMDRMFFQRSTAALLGKTDYTEEDLISVSPPRLVSKNTPPTFLWGTSGDKMVAVQHTLRMAHALADTGVPFDLHIYEEGNHGLSLASQATAMNQSQLKEDAAQWIHAAEQWLSKRFALELPEAPAFGRPAD